MGQYFYELKFFLQVAWYKFQQEASDRVILMMAAVAAVVLLLWLFLLPGVKKKGY